MINNSQNIPYCGTCKWAGEEFELTNDDYYPKTKIYIQCTLPISDKLRAILPSSFTRVGAIFVKWKNNNNIKYTINGNTCPCWVKK